MITFEKIKDTKNWMLMKDGDEVTELHLTNSSVTNKYYIVIKFIENISKQRGEEFDDWVIDFILQATDENTRRTHVEENITKLKDYVDDYIDSLDIDFSKFVDETKAKKSSILFMPDEIEQISRVSGYLKLYSLISNTTLKLSDRNHREIYNALVNNSFTSEIVFKIFNVIKTKTFKYKLTDRYMWDYIHLMNCKDIDSHVVEIFNFIMNQIIVLCEPDKNPIIFFVTTTDEAIKWFLRSVYKESIIYNDEVIHDDSKHTSSIDSLQTFTYTDTITRLKRLAYKKLYAKLEKSDTVLFNESDEDAELIKFQNRLSKIQHTSPICECLTYPVLSKITNIPYHHYVSTLSSENAAVISYYLNTLMVKYFPSNKFHELFLMLRYYTTRDVSDTTTYKLKDINTHFENYNKLKNFFGFNTKYLPYNIVSYFIGRMSRIPLYEIMSGKKWIGVPLSKIETDAIEFFSLYFANKFTSEFDKIKIELESEL